MAFKGTATRDARRINLDAERLGAEVNAHTDRDHTAFYMRGLPQHARCGRAAHQAPEVDGECVVEPGSGLVPGDLVACVVTGSDGADLLVAPKEVVPR